ncbi:MAG: PA3496 family putative envelope integrity protein [Porticoccaceae bacterium]
MVGDADKVPEDNDTIDDEDILEEADGVEEESSTALKSKIKHDCDCRKRLEKKLEESRLNKQIQDYDFDDLD